MAEQDEKRRFVRVSFDCAARLCCDDSEWPATLIDISLKGALITRPDEWEPSATEERPCRLELLLGGGDVVIEMEGGIAHIEGDHVGFRCDHIGLESISHLKRLLELNLGDERLLERELFELAARDD